MVDENITQNIIDDVVRELSELDSVMTDDNESVCGDFINHAIYGYSLVEDMLFSYVDACIFNRIEKLPSEDLENLLWNTNPGQDLHFELEWAREHHPEQLKEIGVPVLSEIRDDIVSCFRNKLFLRAEKELMKREAKS